MLAYLVLQSRYLFVAATLGSIASGLCSVLLIAQINAALTSGSFAESIALAWRFAALAVGAMLTRMVSSILFERLSQRVHADLRSYISERVVVAEFRKIEEIGGPKIYSALSEHSTKVADFFASLPLLMVNAVIVIGCLIYMAWLSWSVFLAAVVVIVLGSLGYHFAHLRAIRHLGRASKEQDNLFDHFRSLVDGAKELRLNFGKRDRFLRGVLGSSIEAIRRERALGMAIFSFSVAWGNFLIYAFIGLVIFVLVGDVPDRAKIITGFALVFVYMVVPLESLLLALPRANLAKVAGTHIDDIASQLERTEGEARGRERSDLNSLALMGVTHRYYHEGIDDLFTLGPIDLAFSPGQITYLIGGNGSGKTTLAKLIVGLYKPEQGEIWLNGACVDDMSRDEYRQIFATIFSDFHLFEQLLDATSVDQDAWGNALLTKLHLHHKVQVRNGAFTTQALSQGQRKRLALVVAYMEDRPFFLFDEWAADQDPVFKEVFYRELLPELKAKGKSVLVITHDDRYFHLADRIVRMENGSVVSIVPPSPVMSAYPQSNVLVTT